MSNRLPLTLLAVLGTLWLLSAAIADGKNAGQPELPRVLVKINEATLDVELATSSRQRYHGLSFRSALAENEAMLFVYPSEKSLLFTMRNTSIPLSIAFIDEDLVINEILDMQPFDDGPYPARFASKYALETNQGWFARNDVKVGDRLSLERGLIP